MKRIVEPELMEGEEQSLAYAQADFEQPHSHFVQLLQEYLGKDFQGYILDLGCGSGDITLRVAKAYPNCIRPPAKVLNDRHFKSRKKGKFA